MGIKIKTKIFQIAFIVFSLSQVSLAQIDTYKVKLAPFSSSRYDEFCPVFYKRGIVFCSDRKGTSIFDYSSEEGKSSFKINYIDTTSKVTWKKSRLFSKALTTRYNDGPVTFNKTGDTIYFSRNLIVDGKLSEHSSARNKLGIYSAVLRDGKWEKVRGFRFNNEWYNITTPCLSPDGSRLFFASDMPGGYGGFDIYYSQWKNGYWDNPENLGSVINTKGNEAYPFINPAGELYFSSDGHPGMGGNDIFVSMYIKNEWLSPVRLDPPVNSKSDDFGIITDSLMREGYFSSNRDNSVDIFHFKTIVPQIIYTTVQKENQYCFTFSDSGAIEVDSLILKYVWNFGDGIRKNGAKVNHCFKGPGQYRIRLDIIDRSTGKLFFTKLSYDLNLSSYKQAYINSPDVALKGDTINFDGLKTFFPGYRIISYSWDFGDGIKMTGEKVQHAYEKPGEYMANLGVTLKSDSTGNLLKTGSSKKILILDNHQEITNYQILKSKAKPDMPSVENYENAHIYNLYSAESAYKQGAVFQIEILSASTKPDLDNSLIRKVPTTYALKEIYDKAAGRYSYVLDQQMYLMATYLSYKELQSLGFKDAHTKLVPLTDSANKELNALIKIFGVSTDNYFDSNRNLTSTAYLLLDQLTRLMNKYSDAKLEIKVYSDNTGSKEANLKLTQQYAQILTSYIEDKGISKNRIKSRGFGASVPIASNNSEKTRALNRRVDFNILNE